MDRLMMRAATMIGCGADEGAVRAIVLAEAGDAGLAYLVFTAARILANGVAEDVARSE